MIKNIDLRWKIGRAKKGSKSIPKKLQYRVQESVRVTEGSYSIGRMSGHNELRWSEWRDVPESTV
jgi:hypothetical protein